MAQCIPDELHIPFEEEVKTLDNEDLLDCWEQSQVLEVFMEGEPVEAPRSTAYERVILQELQLRRFQIPPALIPM